MASPGAIKLELENGRYRLYAAMSCPFAHRVRLVRLLREGLEDVIDMTFVTAQTVQDGFIFSDVPEPEFGATSLKQVYLQANPEYTGKYSVPIIVDKVTKKMVANESLDLAIALLNQTNGDNLLPDGAESLARELNDQVTVTVYQFLFGADDAKPTILKGLWDQLDYYESLLGKQPYLMGSTLTLPDLVLWATLIRYDNVYARQFGVTGKVLKVDYPILTAYAKKIWNMPSAKGGVTLGEDANMSEIVRMYWQSETLASPAGNDPTAPIPQVISIF